MNLTEEQRGIVEATPEKGLCIACPGSGKTHTVVAKIAHEIRQGVNPLRIVAITFTRAAAGELEERISRELGEHELTLGFCGTLHSFCVKLLQEHLGETFSVIDERQTQEILEAEMKHLRFTGSKKSLEASLSEGFRAIMLKPRPSPSDLVVKGFFVKLKAENLFTFDMLLEKGLEILTEIRKEPAGHGWEFDQLYVDEFQDSGPVDDLIYSTMPVSRVLKVGDPRQAIYGFRGGDVSLIENEIRDPSTTKFDLTFNFRSTPEIVHVANRLIPALGPMNAASRGMGHVSLVEYGSEGLEMAGVTKGIIDTGFAFDDCAILLRSNWLVGAWVDHLKKNDVPVRYRTAPEWPEDWAKLRDFLALLADPDNDRLAFRAIEHSRGREIAAKVYKDAASQMVSINQLALHLSPDMNLEEILRTLESMKIASQTLRMVDEVCREGVEVKDATEAILRLSELDFDGKETGAGVYVGTIHSSKGREWASVWLPCLEEGILPSPKAPEDEERRLLYVGATRAEYELAMSYSRKRENRFNRKIEDREPSRFLEGVVR